MIAAFCEPVIETVLSLDVVECFCNQLNMKQRQ